MPRKRKAKAGPSEEERVEIDLVDGDDDVPADERRRSGRIKRALETDELFLFTTGETKEEQREAIRRDVRRHAPAAPAAHRMVLPTEGMLLNDTLVDFWVKYYTAKLLTDEQRRRVHIFNSFFMKRLRGAHSSGNTSDLSALLKWVQHIDLFEKELLFFPVHENRLGGHWTLAVACFPRLVTQRDDAAEGGEGGAGEEARRWRPRTLRRPVAEERWPSRRPSRPLSRRGRAGGRVGRAAGGRAGGRGSGCARVVRRRRHEHGGRGGVVVRRGGSGGGGGGGAEEAAAVPALL